MVPISIGWQTDGDFGGYGQPLYDTAILVVRDANDHGYRSLESPAEGIQGSETATFMFLGLPYMRDDRGIPKVCNLL
jgi:hypothetical protein